MAGIFIAEVKTQSPFGFQSEKSWNELFDIADEHGDWLSIHTDYRWGGSFDLLRQARKKTDKPILAKGVHAFDEEVREAVDSGADSVLVVGRLPGVYVDYCLFEPYNLDQLNHTDSDVRAVWNQRDLMTGRQKTETFEDVRRVRSGWLAQASLIETPDDVSLSADAYIVGAHLPGFVAYL